MSQRPTSQHRDTFWFPYACRRDHRAHTRGLIAGFLFVFIGALLLGGSIPVRADEVEHDVILGAFEEFFADTEADVWEVETFEAHTANFGELWADLPADSYCELWTSAGFLLSLSAEAIASTDEVPEFAPGVAAAIYLIPDLDRMAEDCLKEGI